MPTRRSPLSLLALVLIPTTVAPDVLMAAWPAEMLEDAELADVCFVDHLRGWAVGDRGVIWQTSDGGRHWRLQPSPVTCRLESVFFLDADTGWAVGGVMHGYTHKSTGVVLQTRDGGRRWVRVGGAMLPALKWIKMFDTANGWAVGNSSAMYPAGVFRTDDGGRSWTTVPGGEGRDWLAGDFRDLASGVVAGRDGTLATVRRNGFEASRSAGFGPRYVRALERVGPTGGWLVGDGGLALTTVDGGLSWQMPAGQLPDGVRDQFDFAAVALHDDHCWIAGSPGTCVLHSPDGGRSWSVYRTGQQLPIHGLRFVDRQQGWAVGALGTILATHDGGRSWKRVHSGGTRVALAGFYSEPLEVPLELFVKLSGSEGYLGVVEVLNRRDLEVRSGREVDLAERAHAALVAVGACGLHRAWRFPLRQRGLRPPAEGIIADWDRANDGRGVAQLEAHLVRKIRQWRPDVIVTQPASPHGDDPLAHLVNRLVLAAVDKAADPTSYTDQLTVACLAPWKTKKVFSTLKGEQTGTVSVSTAQLAPSLGRSLADQAAIARALLVDEYRPSPNTIGSQLLVSRLAQDVGRRDVFSGITLQPGGDARRTLSRPAVSDLATLHRMAKKRRNVRQLLARWETSPQGGGGWLGQVEDLTRGMDTSSAAEILCHLAQRYRQTGRPEMAAEMLRWVAERYADHPLSRAASVRLVQYYASSETAWRLARGSRYAVRQVTVEAAGPHSPGIAKEAGKELGSYFGHDPIGKGAVRPEVQVRGSRGTAGTGREPNQRVRHALAWGKVLARTRPALFAEPSLRFPLAVSYRALGMPREAESYFNSLTSTGPHDAWSDCARSEQWLAHGNGIPPKRIWKCHAAATRPRLDGRLDDTVWQAAKTVELKSARQDDGDWLAAARLAYDQEFLYLAISCRQAPGLKYPTTDAPRSRDPDLSDRDRVDLLIDLDRDYVTYWRLTVDHRGWTGEACWGDTTWNPNWYVSAATERGIWTVEAAIPLEELTSQPPRPRDTWALGVQRTVPGVGFQSWTQPAAVEVVPEGFGLLLFD